MVLDLSTRLNAALKRRDVEPPEPGIYPGTSFETYHSWRAASNSRLSVLREKTPAHLKAEMDQPTDTAALRMGRALHCAVLEPDAFPGRYGRGPEGDRRSKAVREQWDEMESRFGDGFVLKPDEHARCIAARDALWTNPSARALLSGEGMAELSMVWTDDETGIPCKARLDRLTPKIAGGAIVDVKKTRDASRRAFEKAIYKYGYHSQGAWYLDGSQENAITAEHFVIVAQEDVPPFATAVYRINEAALEAGREQLRPLVRLFAECMERDEWPGYPSEVRDLALPDYAWNQIDLNRDETI